VSSCRTSHARIDARRRLRLQCAPSIEAGDHAGPIGTEERGLRCPEFPIETFGLVLIYEAIAMLVHGGAPPVCGSARAFARPFAKAIIRERTQDKVAGEGFDGTTSPRAATPQISH
jgi:hypothetical protein